MDAILLVRRIAETFRDALVLVCYAREMRARVGRLRPIRLMSTDTRCHD